MAGKDLAQLITGVKESLQRAGEHAIRYAGCAPAPSGTRPTALRCFSLPAEPEAVSLLHGLLPLE
jgi:hypothetical protein